MTTTLTSAQHDILRIIIKRYHSHPRLFPRMIAPHLHYFRVEQTLRRDFAHLLELGYLTRNSPQGGYKYTGKPIS